MLCYSWYEKVSDFKFCPFYYNIKTINAVLAWFNMDWQVALAPQFKRSGSAKSMWTDRLLPLIPVSAQNKHEWTSEGMLKERVQLTEIRILSHIIAQSEFQPRKDVSVTACTQFQVTSYLPQKKIFGDHKLASQLEKLTLERRILLNIYTV